MNYLKYLLEPIQQKIIVFALVVLCLNSSGQRFDYLTNSERLAMLEPPKGKTDIVIDSDTFNEIDDQYALVYALKSQDKLNIKAIYAAPFVLSQSDSPGEGMQKSYNEILRILDFIDIQNYAQAQNFLVETVKKQSKRQP